MTANKKKVEDVVDELLDGKIEPEAAVLKLAEPPKPKPKPGEPDYDWSAEYPDEEVYVYTVPEGRESPAGLTIGVAKLGKKRKPRPGVMRRMHREGPMSVMWYFLEVGSSPASLAVQEQLEDTEYAELLREWSGFAGIELSE